MFAMIRIYDEAAGLADAVGEHRDDILGLFEEVPGFRGYQMVKTGDTSCLSITLFDDMAGAEESSRLAKEWIAENLKGMRIRSPQMMTGEVTMSSTGVRT